MPQVDAIIFVGHFIVTGGVLLIVVGMVLLCSPNHTLYTALREQRLPWFMYEFRFRRWITASSTLAWGAAFVVLGVIVLTID